MKLALVRSVPKQGDAHQFVFKPETPVTWLPGQYIHYTLPHDNMDDRGDKRWFTISANPSEGLIAITTRINTERSSSFKKALMALQSGDTIEGEAPEGDFTVEDPSRDYIFIAGGIGITPYRSILSEAAVKNEQLNVTLVYANRTSDIVFQDELTALQQQNPNLKVRYVIQPEKLDEALLKEVIQAVDNPIVYISGPEPMVESLMEQVADLGVSKDNIKGDYFPGYPAE